MKSKLKYINKDIDDIDDRFINLEKSVTQVEQYTRRENFEITGVPENIPQEQLEAKVFEIVNDITEKDERTMLTSKDIHACHRLRKEKDENGARVIVRIVNRKNNIDILKNKKKLMDKSETLGQLYINENLCQENKNILEVARQLKKDKQIHSCWSYNGIIHIKIKERDYRGIKNITYV